MVSRLLIFVYGVVCYAFFFLSFLYAIAFVGDLPVPKTVDSGVPGPVAMAVLIDVLLLGLFALQHSVMARPAFKARWTKLIPETAERSTYVLAASAALVLLYLFWQPLPANVWTVEQPGLRMVLVALFWAGFGIVLISTFLINHFELFGLAQVFANLRGRKLPEQAFRTPLFYRLVRHPIYTGFFLAFWSTPLMTQGHLLFAIATSGYMLIGIFFEERDLVRTFGEKYLGYRRSVPMLIPFAKLPGGPK
jgi:protein-S-isoprenylcysteine O-methyltransferase Ste14